LTSGGDVYFALVNDYVMGLDCDCGPGVPEYDTCDSELCVRDKAECVGDLNLTLEIEAQQLGAAPGTMVEIAQFNLADDSAKVNKKIVRSEGKLAFPVILNSFRAELFRLRLACGCDLNNDGNCDMLDWLVFGVDWGRTDCNEPGVEPCECDLNGDGNCDMLDWLLFGQDWGRTDCPVP
jgi:hypothetical protein